MISEEKNIVVSCPGCHKKFRIPKSIRFQCKYCRTLIDPDLYISLEESRVSIPDVLRGTKEDLVDTFQNLNKKRQHSFFPTPKHLMKKLAYQFDNFISYGPLAMFLTLAFFFVATWIFCLSLYFITGYAVDMGDQIWETFLQICDPSSMEKATEKNFFGKLLAVITGFLGIVIFSLVIAFLTNIFAQKLEELKKGHSSIVEEDHTLILGWSDKVPSILEELIVANDEKKSNAVVILSHRPKEELEDYLRSIVKNRKTTKIVVRCGEISNISNLEKVAISHCQSIIIVNEVPKNASKTELALSDTHIIKAILSICKNPARRPESFNIVTELLDPKNIDIAKSIGEEELTVFYSNEIIAKILVQTSRQNGLATVYNEILSFAGNEIYCINEPGTHGQTMSEIVCDFPHCIPIGLKQKGRSAQINPPMNTVIGPGDEILLVAEDEKKIYYQKSSKSLGHFRLPSALKQKARPERYLLLGWNAKSESIIREYSDYLSKGSVIDVAVPYPSVEIEEVIKKFQKRLDKIEIRLLKTDYRLREELDKIIPFSYDNIILLSSQWGEAATIEEIDSQTIYTLLLLRDMQNKAGKAVHTKLVTELLDPANQELIQIAKVNDVIISNQLISMLLAQVSRQKSLYEVYWDLFRAEGSEIYIKSVSLYFERLPVEVNFYDILGVVSQRKEIAFGYRIQRWGNRADLNFGIKLNPDKQKKILLDKEDQLVVVAEDEF
ncbi:MAG: hypothetical protein HUU50_06195 [Candidatus Brocadiae bacterium]|nr:hypothetical protein [Candidatus Brocadiia bacterium]